MSVLLMVLTLLMPLVERLLANLLSRQVVRDRLSDREKARVNRFIFRARKIELTACDLGATMGGTPD